MSKASKGIPPRTANVEATEYHTGNFAGINLAPVAGSVELYDASNALVGTFTTIQAAITAAGTGYTILIGDGIYAEQLNVNGKTDLTIRAFNNGQVTVLSPDVLALNGHSDHFGADVRAVIAVNDSTNVTIQGLIVDGSFSGDTTPGSNGDEISGIGYFRSSGAIDDVAIVHVGNSPGGGLFGLQHGSGLFIDGEPTPGLAVSVTDSEISDFQKTGVLVFGVVLTFTGNAITGIGGTGLTAQNGLQIGNAQGLIDGNTISGFGYSGGGYYSSGIIAYEPTGALSITNNAISGAGVAGSSVGIDLSDVGNVAVVIGDNSFDALDYGLYAYTYTGGGLGLGTAPVLSDNSFTNIGVEGLHIDPEESYGAGFTTSSPFNLTGSDGNDTLAGSAGTDSLDGADGNDTLTGRGGNDSITGGSGTDTAVVGTGATFTANGSSWTVTSSDGSDTLSGVEIVSSGSANTLLVGAGGFATIQEAVNAAQDGDTILVASGTYIEQVVIDGFDNLTIRAADGATVTIQAPLDVHQTATSSSGRSVNAVVTVTNGTNVVLDNINVDGAGHGNTVDGTNANFIGIFYRNASGTLLGVDIGAIREPYVSGTTVSGNQRGVGLQVDNSSLLAFTMTGGSIFDFQKNATVFNYAILSITGVTVTGGGAQTINAQNGFQVSNSTGSISGNTITGIGFAGAPGTYSAGVLAFGNTNLDILGNIITGTNGTTLGAQVVGIYVLDFGTPNSGGTISGNTVSYVDTGIAVYGNIQPNGITVGANSVTNIDTTDPYAAGVDFEPNPGLAAAFDVTGTGADDILFGAAGNDNLKGLGGNDDLRGNGGDDTLTGGDGDGDTAIYAGPRADYIVSYTTDANGRVTGFTSVADNNGAVNGDDGTDALSGIEALQFSNQVLNLGDPVQLFDASGNLVGTFATIQAAINAASANYRIEVAAGTYNENLNVDKDITIDGPNEGIAGTGARGAEAIINGLVSITADGVTLNGFTITGAPLFGQDVTAIYVSTDNVTLTNLILDGPDGGYGIQTPYGGGATGLLLSNSLVTGWDAGAYFNPSTGFTATGNSFDGNGNGFVGDDWAAGTFIDNNSFTNSGGSHIGYGSLDSVEDVQTYFGSGNSFEAPNRPVSIFAYGAPGGQEISGTEESNRITGEYASGSGDSTFHGRGGDDLLQGFGGNDVLDGGTGNDTLEGGSGTDTAYYAGNRAGYTVNFVTNAHGTVTGVTGVTDTNLGNGDEGTDTFTGVEVVRFSNVTFDLTMPVQLFDTGGNLIGTFATIQGAVDASTAGYTIRIAAGTYTENVNFHTAVTVLGAHSGEGGATRIGSAAAGETTLIGRHDITAPTGAVTLDGLRFVNNGSTTGGAPDAILQILTGGGHVVTNSVFYSEVQGGNRPSPDDRAISMPVIGDGQITISNNYFTGAFTGGFGTASWGRAVWFDGGGVDLSVTGNTIEYSRTGLNLDMSGDSQVAVSDNHFTTTGTAVAVGVDMVGLTFLNNDFTNAGEEFNFRNQTLAVTFDAELAVDAQSGDFINVLGGQGGDTLYGTSGSDLLDGNQLNPGAADNDALDGRAGGDVLFGRGGDDTLTGGAGDDFLFGGSNLGDAGFDSAIFSGNRADYAITVLGGGVIQFVDTRDGSPDGTDQLSGIERVVFADDAYLLGPGGSLTLINSPPVAVDDVNSAVEDGPVVAGSVATNDSDPDAGVNILSYALNGTVAGLAINPDGSYSFNPANAAYQHIAVGTSENVVATYTVTDEHGATDTGTLTITVTGTNDAPVVAGAVTASVSEGSGVHIFNPLANASDPDAGDGLVVIPVGPLPAGVSFVGGSAATISFSDYALGSVVGQHGWTDGSPGSPDNEIVDVSGNRMLRLANDPTSGDFAGPFSPAFAISAGEAAAPADTLSFSFVIKAVNGVPDGSRLEIDLGSSDRDDRYNFMAIEYTATGLRLLQNTPLADPLGNWQSNNFNWGGNVQLIAGLDPTVAHTIQVVFRAVDGSNNDIVEYYVDGNLVGTGSTFENLAEFHAGQPHASAINSVNNVLFRAGDPAGNPFPADGPGGNRQGFYIDDLAMSAYDSHQLRFNADDPAYDHLAAGATQLVTVTYNVADGHGGLTPASTVITVTGTNDGATITGVATGTAVESGVGPGNTPVPGTPTASGMLSVSDVDNGEAELAPVNAAGANGYGNFAVAANGSWTYTLDNGDTETQGLHAGQVVTDTILVHSEDGTASQTITVTITGTNDAPVVTSGPGAASGSVNEGISPNNLTPAGAAGGLEPAVNYDGQIVSLLAAHPDNMPAVLAGIQALLPAGSNGLVNAIAVMWDYVDDHYSYYDTVINEISGRLSAEYARYLVLGGQPLIGTVAKYAPDGGDGGTNPDRQQSLHDNLLGNLSLAGLNDKLRGPPNGSNPNPDESAYNQIIALLASYGLSDVVNRPYFGGYEGDANLATAYDQTHGLLPPATGGQLTASDVDDDAVLTWSGTGTSVYGAFAITAGGAWTYNLDNFDPDTQALAAGMSAVETFTATVTDNHGATATQIVTVVVHGTNDAPVAVADVNSGTEDGALVTGTVAANDSDVDTGAVLSYALAAPVAGLTINPNGSYSFDPGDAAYDHIALGATQVVTANYIVSDGNGGSSTSTLTITVTGINDAPDAVNDTASAIEDGAVVLGSVAGNDTDIDDGATRSWALVAPVAGLTLDSAGNYVFNPLDPAYQHIAAGATQTVVASYRVTDQHGATDIATLTITVAGTNDAPDAANDVNGAAEDGAIVTGNVGSNDSDVDDGATRTFALVAAPPAGLTFNPDGSYSFNPSNAAYQHLAVGATDTLVISYTISDGSATDTATLTITVNGTNDAPVAADDVNTAIEDGAVVTGTVATGDTDVDDGATRTYALSGSVAGLTINSDGSYSFDPASYDSIAAGDTQIVTATYIVTDDHGATDTGTLTITVSGINDAPDAVNDTASAVEDGAVVTGTVATNDTDADIGDTRTYTLNAPVAGLTLNSNGSYSFNPVNAAYQHLALGATQTVVATYTFMDNNGESDTATLTITVTGTNDAPDAVADTIVATEDGPVVSGSLGVNDTDADDGATRTYLLVAPVTGLTLTPSGNYTFDPSSYDSIAAGSSVTLTTSYRVIDNNGATDTATISITIHGINDAPDAVNDVATAIEDGAIVTGNVSFNDIDPDSGDSRTYAQFGVVAGLTINSDGSYSFDPSDAAYQHIALGMTQTVVATYTMTDGAGVTDTATLTITVAGRNDAPLALFDLASASEDGGIIIGNVGDNDVDVDDGAARGFIPTGPVPAGLTFNPDGSYSFDPSDAAYQHLAAGVTEAVILSYRITDQHGATGNSTLTITVTGTNDGPIAADDVGTAIEDGAVVTGNVGAGDTDADDGAILTYALNGTVPGLTIAANGDYSFDPSNAAYQHLAQGATDTIVATYTVTDQFGATDTATLTITVAGANDAPVALDDSRAVNEDGGTITGNVGGNDTDADDGATRSFTAVGPLPAGLIFSSDGSYSFNPSDSAYQHLAQGVTQAVTLTYTIDDGLGATDTATLTITVTGVNDAPDAVNDVASATEDGAVVTGTVATNDSDADAGDTRTYALVAPVTGLTFGSNGSYSFDPSSYDSLAFGATQNVVATYTLTDGQGVTDTATLTITVTGINDAPDAVNDVASATEDGAIVTGTVATNDSDVDAGDTRTYALVAPVAGLTLDSNGSYSFDPSSYDSLAFGATQIVVATYTLTDGQSATDTATLTITVTGINDAPDAVNDVASATEDGAIVTGTVATNDSDADAGDTRTYALVAPVTGLTFGSNGSYSFDPSSYDSLAFGATQIVVATYTLTDGQGVTDTATLTITVTGVNDAPDALNDIASATEDGATVTGTVATNDSDADAGDTRTYALAAPVEGLTLDSNGSYSFDPSSYDSLAFGATQNVVATYTMADGQGATDTATLTITVTGVNDAPDAVNDVASATEGGAVVTGSVATNDSDVDAGDTRTYTLNTPMVGLMLGSTGNYAFVPMSYHSLAAGATQNLVATYTMTDGQGATDTATLTITITGVNDGPDAVNDVASATEDGATVTGTVATNDTDADIGDTRTYTLSAPVAGLTLDSNGSYIFDPSSYDSLAAGATQNVVATYIMTDGQGATDTATLTITVTGVDDAPVARPDAFVTNEATILSGNLLADNGSGADVDVDGPAPTISAVNGLAGNVGSQITLASGALLTVNANGTFTYNPNGVFNTTPAGNSGASNLTVPDSFTYTLAGGGTATVSLTITGLDTNDILFGTAGGDVLNGGAGLDIMIGLGGNDTYYIDNVGDQVLEANGQGFDAIYTSVSYALTGGVELEWLSAAAVGGTGAINLTGNEFANYVLGNNGVNILDGGGGSDVLVGYGGNDVYYVDSPSDFVIESVGGGFDAVYTSTNYTLSIGAEVEWLSTAATYATDTRSLTGNEYANTILGNQGVNVLDGAGGADVLVGYGGNDTYYVDSTADFVIENAGGGFDAVYTSASYTLFAGAEVEWLATTATYATTALSLTGNEIANIILGNDGANVINGAGGADVLVGYGGADTFAFTTALGAGNVDMIIDFAAGTDKIGLDDAVFTAIGGLGPLNANAFVIGGGAADASDRIIYNSTTGELFYDSDGLGGAAQILFATLNQGLSLTASDFQVI
jgi:VCBS repeat-containing protein